MSKTKRRAQKASNSPAKPSPSRKVPSKPPQTFTETPDKVLICVDIAVETEQDVKVETTESTLTLTVRDQVIPVNLAGKIIPGKETVRVRDGRLFIFLPKAEKETWGTLEALAQQLENTHLDTMPGTWTESWNQPKKRPRHAGLYNLGQTCYINSVLQAVSSTPELSQALINDSYQDLINHENFLGHNGEMVDALAHLVKQLLKPEGDSFAPRQFLQKLRKLWFALEDEFRQHDAQEFMTFLLDAVHEDLNQVKDRSSVPNVEDSKEGEEESAIAQRFQSHHRALNSSLIQELFQGLYKSTTECKECRKKSIRFDAFTLLSVPLPVERFTTNIFYMSTDTRLVKNDESFTKESKFSEVLQRLPKTQDPIIAIVRDHKITQIMSPNIKLGTVPVDEEDTDICVYELPEGPHVALYHVHHEESYPTTFATPMAFNLPETSYTIDKLYQDILKVLIDAKLIEEVDPKSHPPPFVIRPGNARRFRDDVDGEEAQQLARYQTGQDEISEEEVFDFSAEWTILALHWFDKDKLKDPEFTSLPPSKQQTKPHQNKISLQDCIHLFFSTEELEEANWFHCPNCKKPTPSTKTIAPWTLPQYLVIQLKRFQWREYQNGQAFCSKIDPPVDFPLEADFASMGALPEGSPPTRYRLYAVVNHMGRPESGHYTAYCDRSLIKSLFPSITVDEAAQLAENGPTETPSAWFEFDDEAVKPVEETQIQTRWAYLLFYKRVD